MFLTNLQPLSATKAFFKLQSLIIFYWKGIWILSHSVIWKTYLFLQTQARSGVYSKMKTSRIYWNYFIATPWPVNECRVLVLKFGYLCGWYTGLKYLIIPAIFHTLVSSIACIAHRGIIRLPYDVIKWKHFPRYLPFMRGSQRSPVNSQRPVTRSFDVLLDLRSLWHHCNANMNHVKDWTTW